MYLEQSFDQHAQLVAGTVLLHLWIRFTAGALALGARGEIERVGSF